MASHSGSILDMSEELYGMRPSVWHRCAKTLGDIHREIDACYSSKVVFQKWFDVKGKKLITGALENPRVVLSSQRRCKKRISKKGSTTQVEASPRATKMRRSSSVANNWLVLSTWHTKKILLLLQQGVPSERSLPLDVKIEIVEHSNRHDDGIKITVLEIAGVAEVQQAFANSLSAKM